MGANELLLYRCSVPHQPHFIRFKTGAFDGATVEQQLVGTQAIVESLAKELEEARGLNNYYEEEYSKVEERAKTAEEDYRNILFTNRQLKESLTAAPGNDDATLEFPKKWEQFYGWCQAALDGRVKFAPSARKGIRSPDFSDVELAARCLHWLATESRDQRLGLLNRDLRDVMVEDGIRHAPCGGDSFYFNWQGRELEVDWHIKNGGNTRDPTRCLRIYYGWDDATQQIIIAEMPGHRTTGAS